MQYVYILLCSNGRPYIGCTSDLRKRFLKHSNGQVPSTQKIRPVQLVFYCAFIDKHKAFAFEKYL